MTENKTQKPRLDEERNDGKRIYTKQQGMGISNSIQKESETLTLER